MYLLYLTNRLCIYLNIHIVFDTQYVVVLLPAANTWVVVLRIHFDYDILVLSTILKLASFICYKEL